MEPARVYQLDCSANPDYKDPKNPTFSPTFSVQLISTSSDQSSTQLYSEADRGHLYRFITDLDYVSDAVGDSQTPVQKQRNIESGTVGNMTGDAVVNSEGGVSVDSGSELSDEDECDETRTLSEEFSFKIKYNGGPDPRARLELSAITSGVVERLVNLQQLAELHLSQCPLTEDSEYKIQFGAAYNLRVLRLEQLRLRRLHPSIGRLRCLTDLSLRYNRLTDLPLTIRLLRNLRTLDITGNPFRRLPGAVYHLNLKYIVGLNECPLNKDIGHGWVSCSAEIWWMKPLGVCEPRENTSSLQECSIQAAVGMDCWKLDLPERISGRLTKMAETQGLCENCLKSIRKLTIDHESLGFTIHAQLAVFCGVRDLPFSFMACSTHCLELTLSSITAINSTAKMSKDYSKLPCCDYQLKFVQDLEEFQRQRAEILQPMTYQRSYGRNDRNKQRTQSTTNVSESSWRCVIS